MSIKDGSKDMELDKNVEFLYKSMMTRDPKKRQVKLVQPHLMQLDFGSLEDSSDDSDFQLNSDDGEDDDEFDDDDTKNRAEATKSDGSDDDGDEGDEEDDEDEDEDQEEDDGDDVGVKESKKEKRKNEDDDRENKENAKKKIKLSGDEPITEEDDKQSSAAKSDQQTEAVDEEDDKQLQTGKNDNALSNGDVDGSKKRIVVPVCSVCMGDSNTSMNEIVECDGCHETVHEGCFGVSDSHSTTSSDSSSSMEPWFCDACKAGAKPHCELCPNPGGIFKETDSGRWVHLICALYTKGIAFGDVERLSNITLFEMPYSKWGAKECSLCEDPRFSRTGVCISCDAGMCRVHFHVTCAQRHGLLTEASPEEAKAIADPYFAYCKIHADKQIMRHNHRNWLALRSNVKAAYREMNVKENEKRRLERKLANHQVKYQEAKYNRQPCWVPKEKMPRMLLSNAYALKQLLRKAELQGVTEDVATKDTRKKGYVPPAFSLDFVSYYLERNELMENIKAKNKEMQEQDSQLRKMERQVTSKIQEAKSEIQKLTKSSIHIQKTGLMLWDFMMNVAGKRIRIPECVSFRNFARPMTADDHELNVGSKQPHRCATCDQLHDQHLLVQCDRCHENYHLGCLDPPLTRMPKKTKSQGWHCAHCTKECLEEEEEENNTGIDEGAVDQPRKLREKRLIREPLKYTTQFAHENVIKSKDRRHKKKIIPPHSIQLNEGNGGKPGPSNNKSKLGTCAEIPAESPLSISSDEDEEEEEEEEEEGEEESMSEGSSSTEGRMMPVEIHRNSMGESSLSTSTNQAFRNPADNTLMVKQIHGSSADHPASTSQVQQNSTGHSSGGHLLSIMTAESSTCLTQAIGRHPVATAIQGHAKSPVKKVIIRNADLNCEIVTPVPVASQTARQAISVPTPPMATSGSSNVRIVNIQSEKKLPIIIRRKQPLLPERNAQVFQHQTLLPVQPAHRPAEKREEEPIEISDDDSQ